MTNLNPEANPTMVIKVSTAVIARNLSQVADTVARVATPKDMVEEINVLLHSLNFWLVMLRWPLLAGQTQGGYGADRGSGYVGTGGGGAGGGGGGGGTQCQSYDGGNTGFSVNRL